MFLDLWLTIWLLAGCGFSYAERTHRKTKYIKYSFSKEELHDYREEVRALIYFAHDNYLEYAYPYDELRPISCCAKTRNFEDSEDVITNDVLGNFSITLIDSLTTIAILNDRNKFKEQVDLIERTFPSKFDLNSTIQVFETTIRILGSLISSHLYATDPSKKVYLGDEYNGILLELAKDIADRLLPAYLTTSGLPLPRINLRHQIENINDELLIENNVAAMASPMFEFTMLSYLTFDEKYEAVTRYAMNKTWSLRSNLDLLPMSFSPQTEQCYTPITGIGASVDSFYEYALKGSILFNDRSLYQIWEDAYQALIIYCKADWFFVNVQVYTGQLVVSWVDSLSAFFPGLQVLAGDVEDAIYKNVFSLKLWNTFGGIPERWLFQGNLSLLSEPLDAYSKTSDRTDFSLELQRALVPLEWYPLRPEFIESTYYLYRATKDPFYLNIGVQILESFKTRFIYECGFGGIQDVIEGTPQDRMESFVLSETLKYLYLLFDEDNELHHSRDNVIFSTEAHPMWLDAKSVRDYSKNKFFNDSIYLTHLQTCYEKDELAFMRKNRFGNMKDRLAGFAKSFFIDEESGLKQSTNITEQNRTPLNIEDPKCPKVPALGGNNGWTYSPILSQFDRLFEIDNKFARTMKKPTYLLGTSPIEITSGFYQRWANPKKSLCLLPTTTESFYLFIEQPGLPDLSVLENGNVVCHSMTGSLKLTFEMIRSRKIDSYGDYITQEPFEKYSNSINVLDPHNPNRLYSPTYLYRITGVNGFQLPRGANITLNKNVTLNSPEQLKSLTQLFGYNRDGQLIFENIPIINFYLE